MMIYEMEGPGITDDKGHVMKALLYNKTRSERRFQAGKVPGATLGLGLCPFKG